MSVRAGYRRKRRGLKPPPAALLHFTPFAVELQGRPLLMWLGLTATFGTAAFVAAFLLFWGS